MAQNNSLRTRVSELEVINELFRGRVAELEGAEQAARNAAGQAQEELDRLKAELLALRGTAAQAEERPKDENEERLAKRARVEDEVAEGDAPFAEFTNGASQ